MSLGAYEDLLISRASWQIITMLESNQSRQCARLVILIGKPHKYDNDIRWVVMLELI